MVSATRGIVVVVIAEGSAEWHVKNVSVVNGDATLTEMVTTCRRYHHGERQVIGRYDEITQHRHTKAITHSARIMPLITDNVTTLYFNTNTTRQASSSIPRMPLIITGMGSLALMSSGTRIIIILHHYRIPVIPSSQSSSLVSLLMK